MIKAHLGKDHQRDVSHFNLELTRSDTAHYDRVIEAMLIAVYWTDAEHSGVSLGEIYCECS